MTADRPELSAGVAALAEQVQVLAGQVEELTDSNEALAESNDYREKVVRWLKWVTWVHVVFTLGLTTGGWFIGSTQRDIQDNQDEIKATNARLEATNARLEAAIARLEISVGESCSFYGLIIGSYRPESRPPGQDRETYEDNFDRMRLSFQRLKCDPGSIVPPAIPR